MIGGVQQRFGQTPQDLAQDLANAPPGAMVMDVIPGGTQIVSGAAARPGTEREAMRKALDKRNISAVQESIDDIWQSLGGGARRSGYDTVQDLAEQQRLQSKPLYDAAMNRPIDPSRAQNMLGEIVRRNPALFDDTRAQAQMLSEYGTVFNRNDPRYWHSLQMSADNAFERLRNTPGGMAAQEKRSAARALDAYRIQLRRLLGPEFGRAQDIWSGSARQQAAVRRGFDAVDTKANDFDLGEMRSAMRRMTRGELEHMRIGALTKMSDMLENANTMTGRGDPVRTLIRSEGQRRVLANLFGGEAQFSAVVRRLDERQQLFRNSVESGIGVNSHTADRLIAYGSQQARTNPTQGGIRQALVNLITGDAADQYDEAVSNQILRTMRTPARQAAQEITQAGGVQKWSQQRGLLSASARQAQRMAEARKRHAMDALLTGAYAPTIGGGAMEYGGL